MDPDKIIYLQQHVKYADGRALFGRYALSKEDIFHKIRRWNLTPAEKNAISSSLNQELPIFITGKHGVTGKTSLCQRLKDLDIIAYEIDIVNIVMMDTLISDRDVKDNV